MEPLAGREGSAGSDSLNHCGWTLRCTLSPCTSLFLVPTLVLLHSPLVLSIQTNVNGSPSQRGKVCIAVSPCLLKNKNKVFVFHDLCCVSSFADTDPLCYPALLTHHVAAPVELAVAAFATRLLEDVVAPAAAEALTVVHPRAGLVTDPALCPRRVRAQVPLAEVGRLLKVDQLVDVGAAPV